MQGLCLTQQRAKVGNNLRRGVGLTCATSAEVCWLEQGILDDIQRYVGEKRRAQREGREWHSSGPVLAQSGK